MSEFIVNGLRFEYSVFLVFNWLCAYGLQGLNGFKGNLLSFKTCFVDGFKGNLLSFKTVLC